MEWVVLIVIFGLFFDYTNGFHDAANVVSTVIATKVLAPLTAIILAGVLNTVGAFQMSGVAHTIATGLIDAKISSQSLVVSALIGAISWNLITWAVAIPSSSSYALVGGMAGAAFSFGGLDAILWKGVLYKVALPMVISPFLGFFLALVFMKLIERYSKPSHQKLFAHLQISSASLVALAHGMNDAQKSMGIITLGLFSAQLITTTAIPFWVILSCAVVMGLGTAFGGLRIVRTVGYRITHLNPAQGYAAEMSSSCVILAASYFGMPISSTHMITGSIAGVGAAKGMKQIEWITAHKIGLAWLLTFPGAALIAYGMQKLLNFITS